MAYLKDGYQTLITFLALGTGVVLKVKETEVTPPGLDGGDAVVTTTMRNETWETSQPQTLIKTTPGSFTAQYDPAILTQILSIINVLGQIVITYPDGSTETIWGWLRTFTPSALVRGTMPTATCTLESGNQNADSVEIGPAYAAAA